MQLPLDVIKPCVSLPIHSTHLSEQLHPVGADVKAVIDAKEKQA